jgi:hypothetical protein
VRSLAIATVLAGLICLIHSGTWAQEEAPIGPAPPAPFAQAPIIPIIPPGAAGFYLVPSLAITEEFDDNIFATHSHREWDFISRFSPELGGGYRSAPFTLLASAGFDAEVFPRHSDLNDATSGWHAGLAATYLPIRPLRLDLGVAYLDTRTPSTLPVAVGLAPTVVAPATVLQFGLRRATFLTVSPSAAYQFTQLTSGSASYTYTHDTIEAGTDTTAHTAQFRLSHQFTPLDTGSLGYRSTVYEFGESFGTGSTTEVDYAPTVGYTRQLTPQTKLILEGGPLFTSDGSVGPNVSAELDHSFRLATVALRYARSDGFILGEPGVVKTETYSASVTMEPVRSLLVSLSPSITRLFGRAVGDTNSYDLVAGASYPFLRWLVGRLTYRFGYQEQPGGDIFRNVVSLSLEASYPYRIGE